jgi:hypothetical protein
MGEDVMNKDQHQREVGTQSPLSRSLFQGEAWENEIARRSRHIDDVCVEPVPWSEVKRAARKARGSRCGRIPPGGIRRVGEAYAWYAGHEPQAAERFEQEVELAIQCIAAAPDLAELR